MNLSRKTQVDNYFSFRQAQDETTDVFCMHKSIQAILPENRNSFVLDIGCGYGQFLKNLRHLGFNNIGGVDISQEAVNACRKSGLDVIQINDLKSYAESAKRKYDFIMMSHVLEHVDKKDIIDTLNILRKNLLQESGSLCVIVPNAQSETGCYWTYEDFTHMTMFMAGSLFYVLRAAGFKAVDFINPDGYDDYPGFKSTLKKILLKLYIANKHFWRKITLTQIHKPSLEIYTFEIRAIARSK